MNYIWTIQKKEILQRVERGEIYYPSFINEKRKCSESYNVVLNGFNKVNDTKYSGLVFAFAKAGVKCYFESVEELYKYFLDNPLVTNAFNLWGDSNVILQLKYEEEFNMIPVDFNDFTDLMPPSFNPRVCNITRQNINNGVYKGGILLKSFTQVHVPYIKQSNIVNVFENFNKKESDRTGKIVTYEL